MGVAIPAGGFSEDRASGAQVIDGGLRFISGNSQGLTRTPGSAGNKSTWTWSGWVKRSAISARQYIFSAYSGGNSDAIYFHEDDTLRVHWNNSLDGILVTTQLFRDPSAWYHFLWSVDFTQATSTNRVKLYVNGVQITAFSTSTYPSQSYVNGDINNNVAHGIGRREVSSPDYYLSAQLSNVYLIDGQQLDPSYFGFTDQLTNTWRPKKLSSSVAFGTNGFYLPFDGSAPIGQDQSGRGNNWTPVNFGGSNTLEKATGALPILNTDGGGKVARVGVRTDSNIGVGATCILALPLVGITSDFSNQVDSRTNNKAITNNSVTFSSSYSNFYGGSASFNGSSSYLQTTTETLPGDFCIEGWWYAASSGQQTLFTLGDASTSTGIELYRSTTPVINVFGNNTSLLTATGFDYTLNKWQHYALTRSGTSLRLFKDGIQIGSTVTNSTTFDSTLRIGAELYSSTLGQYLNGYVQDFRIYKGLAKYTSNFIPASTDPDIVPDSPSGVSYSSNVIPVTDGAVAFDNDGDYLSLSQSDDFSFGTGAFTCELFCYFNSLASDDCILEFRGNGTSGQGWVLFINGSAMQIYDNGLLTASTTALATKKWYHLAISRTSGGTLYYFVDGVAAGTASWTTSTANTNGLRIGTRNDTTNSVDGFISNLHIVKGTALYTANFTPPSAPISSVANTKLLCCKSQTSATASDVTPGTITANGNAVASNFNPFTANIKTVRGLQSGYATLSPLKNGGTLSNGNLSAVFSSGSEKSTHATMGMSSGKYYWEVTKTGGSYGTIGIALQDASTAEFVGRNSSSWGYASSDGNKYFNTTTGSSYGPTYTTGDIISVSFDADLGVLTFYKNGISLGSAFTGLTSGPYFPAVGNQGFNCDINFGQKPFKFPPPAGFQPLTLANTPRPTIVRPDQYVGVSTWSGDNTTRIFNIGWKPDLIWIKSRSDAAGHRLFDTVRGVKNSLLTQSTAVEDTVSDFGYVSSFNNNGFTLTPGTYSGYESGDVNMTGRTYVGWAWKAGGNSNTYNIDGNGYSTASAAGLTAGTITPTGASVNTKSGFSIITYTGTGANATVAHGLGQAPAFIITKSRNNAYDWTVYHQSLGVNQYLFLNKTDASATSSGYWNTTPTSTIFGVSNNNTGSSGSNLVAYCWAEIPGFSKFGSYSGNSSSDGPTIITNFRPRWVMIKRTDSTSSANWYIYDTIRDTYNQASKTIEANLSAYENQTKTTYYIDVLSNGFKIRANVEGINDSSSSTFIYAAWAETPSFNLYGAMSNAR